MTSNVSYRRLLAVLRRRAPLVIAIAVVAAGAVYGVEKLLPKKFSATASILFTLANLNQQVAGFASGAQVPTQQQQDTDLQLVGLGDVAARTANRLGGGLTAGAVRAAVTFAQVTDTNIVNVTATTRRPALSAQIANTYATIFVEEQANVNRGYYASALALVTKQLANMSPTQRASSAGLTLEARQQSLADLASLQSGNAQLAQQALTPAAPSSPRPSRDAALAAVFAIVLGLGLTMVLEGLDRTVREPEEFERLYALPTLGFVPKSRALEARPGGDELTLRLGEPEIFQLIHAHLQYFNVDRRLRTVLITSSTPGDGKSTVSCQLAAAAARLGHRTLLVDADLRRSSVGKKMHAPSGVGLADALIGAASIDEAVRTVKLIDDQGQEHERTLDVLLAGAGLPPNPAEMIASQGMEDLLLEFANAYDFVIVDTPPLTAVSDALALLRKVDGVIVIARAGLDRRDAVQRTQEALTRADAQALGLVINAVEQSRGSGYYGYNYDYASPEAKPSRRRPVAAK